MNDINRVWKIVLCIVVVGICLLGIGISDLVNFSLTSEYEIEPALMGRLSISEELNSEKMYGSLTRNMSLIDLEQGVQYYDEFYLHLDDNTPNGAIIDIVEDNYCSNSSSYTYWKYMVYDLGGNLVDTIRYGAADRNISIDPDSSLRVNLTVVVWEYCDPLGIYVLGLDWSAYEDL